MPGGFTISAIQEVLPKELATLISKNSDVVPIALAAVNRFSAWFAVSGLPFFKNYTDHSEQHSLEVFSTAVDFISSQAYETISSDDLAILLCACYCHDCGMHITEKQFFALIDQSHTEIYSPCDEEDWPTLWASYLQEAKRYNQTKLIQIFGDTSPIPDLPGSEVDFSDRHRLLVGEFLRKHHPRLAHDVALGLDTRLGLPSLLEGFSNEQRDIVGLVARSHGQSLRSNFTALERDYDKREFAKVHIVYLMGLLRLADYAQIQPSRA